MNRDSDSSCCLFVDKVLMYQDKVFEITTIKIFDVKYPRERIFGNCFDLETIVEKILNETDMLSFVYCSNGKK